MFQLNAIIALILEIDKENMEKMQNITCQNDSYMLKFSCCKKNTYADGLLVPL